MKAMLLFYIFVAAIFSGCQGSQKETPNFSFKNPGHPPTKCQRWYDGCNECQVENGHIVRCTELACFEQKAPRCLQYKSGPSLVSQNRTKCKETKGVFQKNSQGNWVCMYPTTDAHLPCDTSRECQSLCLYYPRKKRGFCSKYKPFVGCGSEYQNGKHFQVCQ